MDLRDYARILRRRGWIILLTAALATTAALGISQIQTPIYQAQVEVSVVPGRPDWGQGNIARDLLRNFVRNMHTHQMAQKAIDRAQLDMSTYDFLERVQVAEDQAAYIIQIVARDRDPRVAEDLARTLAMIFVEERQQYYLQVDIRDRIDVRMVDTVVDATLFRPQPLLNAVAGLVLGVLVGGLFVFALEWLEADILRSSEAVERSLELPVLGAIPVTPEAGGQASASREGVFKRWARPVASIFGVK